MSSHCTSSTKNFIPTQYSMPCAAKSKLNLHFIEFFWGTMKRHLGAVTTYTYSASASKKNPDAMALVVLTIWEWEYWMI